MDRISKEKRSELMSKIRSSNTKFEQNFIVFLKRKIKKRFTINDTTVFGKPDIVFHKAKMVVFLDSDFWHGWRYPVWRNVLNDFWKIKIEKNRKRDIKVNRILRKRGWTVVRIWEHQIKKDLQESINKVKTILEKTK